jgi:hypothetical protein
MGYFGLTGELLPKTTAAHVFAELVTKIADADWLGAGDTRPVAALQQLIREFGAEILD